MGLLFAVALACASRGEPELPAALRESPQVVAAWKSAREGADAAARRAAAALLLDRLASLTAADRLPFLLDCQGSGALLADLEAPILLALSEAPGWKSALSEALLDGAADDLIRERGVLAACGWLGTDGAAEVEALGAALAQPELRAAATEALRRVTGREFASAEEFAAWWESARERTRSEWLAEAHELLRARALRHWAELLDQEPQWGIAAVREPSPAVRRLGYDALARLEPPAGSPPDSPVARALSEAFAAEREPELRLLLVGLVGRFFAGPHAVGLLERSLAAPVPAERLAAVVQLGALRDRPACWVRLMTELWRVYPFGDAPREPLAFRDALWSALNLTLAADAGFAPDPDAHTIGLLIAVLEGLEPEATVRARQYALLARFPQPIFRSTLLRHAAEASRPAQDRAAALDSATLMLLRAEEPDALRTALGPLLEDAAASVRGRAIRGLARLGGEADLARLGARLAVEGEPSLLGEILKVLREQPSAAAFEALLAFAAPPELHGEHVRALQAVVGRDYAALERAVSALAGRERLDGAYALAAAFTRDGLTPELLERHDRMLARTQAEWLIRAGVGGADAARAADALAFLSELEDRWPAEAEWPRVQAELALLLGRTDLALAATERWLAIGPEAAARWDLGLRVARAAAAVGTFDRGWKLLIALGEPPAGLAEEVEQLRRLFPRPVDPEPAEPPRSGVDEALRL